MKPMTKKELDRLDELLRKKALQDEEDKKRKKENDKICKKLFDKTSDQIEEALEENEKNKELIDRFMKTLKSDGSCFEKFVVDIEKEQEEKYKQEETNSNAQPQHQYGAAG